MAPLTSSTSALLRTCVRQRLPAVPTSTIAAVQCRGKADARFESPFVTHDTTKIPDFSKYKSSGGETTGKLFQYFMAGSMGVLTALGAKATVQGRFTCLLHRSGGGGAIEFLIGRYKHKVLR